ncbi:MAG TPA: hypothetical protein VHT91_06570 [Kofleriaceae bacterium]|jgi:hypothetical protein|nr:hypothetical protein [Kofleriaceae bacterium]
MHRLLAPSVVLLVACASSASAEPPAPAAPRPGPAAPSTPAAPAACKPNGAAVFQIDHKIEPGAKLATSAVKLYATGAWTHDETDAEGKAQPQAAGCLARPDVKQVTDALKAAPWKVTTAPVHCMAMSSQFTEYRVDGKLVFTQKLCSGKNLDDKSRAALDKAIALVEPPGTPRQAP